MRGRLQMILLAACCLYFPGRALGHDIIFCGEAIPMSNDFVANKLMDVIKRQVPTVNLPALRQRAMLYFPYVETVLRSRNIPADFKYLPIVESGFQNLTSTVGAGGIWQLMPTTATGEGLTVGAAHDDRTDVQKSTAAACNVLATYYTQILKKYKLSSWVLTAAAYNFGIGNIYKAIDQQGRDYFTMKLNAETAVYVYKIIAVKELFEYPELYMKDFGYNVFSSAASKGRATSPVKTAPGAAFSDMTVKVGANNKQASQEIKTTYVGARIKGKYLDFKDGDLIDISLDQDLELSGSFSAKGTVLTGRGWKIDDRILIDLGFGHAVTVYDKDMQKGLLPGDLKNKTLIVLRNDQTEDFSTWK